MCAHYYNWYGMLKQLVFILCNSQATQHERSKYFWDSPLSEVFLICVTLNTGCTMEWSGLHEQFQWFHLWQREIQEFTWVCGRIASGKARTSCKGFKVGVHFVSYLVAATQLPDVTALWPTRPQHIPSYTLSLLTYSHFHHLITIQYFLTVGPSNQLAEQ